MGKDGLAHCTPTPRPASVPPAGLAGFCSSYRPQFPNSQCPAQFRGCPKAQLRQGVEYRSAQGERLPGIRSPLGWTFLEFACDTTPTLSHLARTDPHPWPAAISQRKKGQPRRGGIRFSLGEAACQLCWVCSQRYSRAGLFLSQLLVQALPPDTWSAPHLPALGPWGGCSGDGPDEESRALGRSWWELAV